MSIRSKVLLGVIIPILGIAVICGLVYYTMNELNEMDRLSADYYEAQILGDQILSSLLTARQYEMLFTNEKRMEYADLVEDEVRTLQNLTNRLEASINDVRIHELAAQLDSASQEYVTQFQQLVSNAQQIGLSASIGLTGEMQQDANGFAQLVRSANQPEILNDMYRLRTIEKDFLIRQNPSLIREFNDQANVVRQAVANSEELTEQQQQSLTRNLNRYADAFSRMSSLYLDQDELIVQFGLIIASVEGTIGDLNTELNALIAEIDTQKDQLSSSLMFILIAAAAIVLAVVLVNGLWLNFSIGRSVKKLQQGAEIIGSGNLAYRVDMKTKDEMGKLAQTFNDMASQVQKSFLAVREVAAQLSSSSQTLAAVSEETTAQTHEVSRAINQVAVGAQSQTSDLDRGLQLLEGMGQHLEDVNHSTKSIAEQASQTTEKGEEGLLVVRELEETSAEFLSLAEHLIHNVKEVDQSSKQIMKIVETIEEISNSTDLLALNAAIESARAGEAGRGFAVVAGEIRKLAEKTKDEARNVFNVIKNMEKNMASLTNEATHLSSFTQKQGVAVDKTKASFDGIVEQVQSINDHVNEVYKYLQSLNMSSANITSAMQDISAIAEESAASSEEVAASSDHQLQAIEEVNQAAMQLQDIAQALIDEISQFKLDGESSGQLDQATSEPLEESSTPAPSEEDISQVEEDFSQEDQVNMLEDAEPLQQEDKFQADSDEEHTAPQDQLDIMDDETHLPEASADLEQVEEHTITEEDASDLDIDVAEEKSFDKEK